jgi:cell division initiation protein
MKLSPLDIRHMEFERAAVGYRQRQVREFLERVAREHESLLAELQELRRAVGDRDGVIESLRASEADLKRTVIAAERIGNEVKEGARREADMLMRQTRHERYEMLREAASQVDAARRELARLDQSQALVREQLRGQLTAFLSALDVRNPPRRPIRDRDEGDDVITALTAAVAAAAREVAQVTSEPSGGAEGASGADAARDVSSTGEDASDGPR